MLVRIISALVLIPITLAIVIYATLPYFLVTVGLIGTLCLHEYFQLTKKMGLSGQPWFGYLGFWALLVGYSIESIPPITLLSGLILAAFIVAMRVRDTMRGRALGLMVNLFGICYLAFCLCPAVCLRFDFGSSTGLQWIIILLAVVWSGDVAALFVGRSLGRTLFSPEISPRKTNEGAAAGLLGGLAVAVLLQHLLFPDLPLVHVMAASLLVGGFGQLGDLAESMLKRAAGVKDSSGLIPGHGGLLDRVDSLLFAFPVLYLYLLILYPS